MSVPRTSDLAPPGDLVDRTAHGIVVRGVAEVIGKLSTLAWTVLAVRILATEDFGALSYGLSVVLLVSAIPSWGFDVGLTRRGSVEPAALPRLYTEVMLLKTLIAVPVFLVVGIALSGSASGQVDPVVLVLLLVAGVPEIWSHTARAASAARQRAVAVSAALVLQRLLVAGLVIAALLAGLGVVGVASGFLVGTAIGWAAHVAATRRLGVRMQSRARRGRDLREAAQGTVLIGLSAVTLMALFRVDTVLLGVLDGPEAVAAYAVAFRLLETVLFVAHAIDQAVLPVMSAASSADDVRRCYESALAVAAFVYLPFAVVCLLEGEGVLTVLFGETYASTSALALAWLAPAPLLFAAGYFGASVLVARQRNADVLVAAQLALVVNLGANLLLIPPLAHVGAAVATTVSYAVQLAVLYLAFRRRGIEVRLARPLVESAVAAALLSACLLVVETNLFLELALGAGLYLVVWWLLAARLAPDQVAVARRLLLRPRSSV